MKFGDLKKLIIVLFASLWCVLACSNEKTLHDSEGHAVQLFSDHKWLVVVYWADWCESCMQEVPQLNRFFSNHPSVSIYGVNFDHLTGPSLRLAMKHSKIAFPVLAEDPRVALALGEINVLPTLFVFNPQGKLVKKIVGPIHEAGLTRIIHEAS